MYRLPRLIAVSLLSFAIPFTAWGYSTNVDVNSELAALQAGGGTPIALPPGVEPPECKLEQGADGDEAGAKPVACCWVHYYGRWWCVSC